MCCGILVEVEHGRAVSVTGDRENPLHAGYTCTKGRGQAALYGENRLLHSQKRLPDGRYVSVPVHDAVEDIGRELARIIDRYGPRAVAIYTGTYGYVSHPATHLVANSFMQAIGSPMSFTPITIDQPGKTIAMGFHGAWMAPSQKFDDIDALLLIGGNPMITYQGFPLGNPSTFLKDFFGRGGQLVVVDPRRTDTAKRATLHLQPRPGEDVSILAGIIRVILDEQLYDSAFVEENVTGLVELRQRVDRFTPSFVAQRADIVADDLVAAARLFAGARRSSVSAGTGPNMSGSGTLLEYLVLCLTTICGRWLRAGETVTPAQTWLPSFPAAQALPPWPPYGFGEKIRVRGLTETMSGLPTGALADEILLEGDGQVRALLSCGGNPVLAWPDQSKTVRALQKLDLLVQVDAEMSATARLADYVIGVKRSLEMPGFTFMTDLVEFTPNYGLPGSYAQYSPAILEPPEGSDLIEDWEFFYDLAQCMGLKCGLAPAPQLPMPACDFDMTRKPTSDDIFALMTSAARVPLEEVKQHPHGALLPDPKVIVAPKGEGWPGRLDIGNQEMMDDLAGYGHHEDRSDPLFPFRLIVRRSSNTMNSASDDPPRKRPYNPAFMNRNDLERLGLESGDPVRISSTGGAIPAIVEADDGLREGLISMTHGFGDCPEHDHDVQQIGSSTARLVDSETPWEKYSGQPRMSNVPVRIEPTAPRDRA